MSRLKSDNLALFEEPLDGLAQPHIERGPRLEPEARLRARRGEPPARLTVRLRGVPRNPAGEADLRGNGPDQILDRNFVTRADVHRLAAVVPFRGQHDRLRGILDIEELARRRPVAPH